MPSFPGARLQFLVLRTLKNISVLGTILKLFSVLAVQITGTHDAYAEGFNIGVKFTGTLRKIRQKEYIMMLQLDFKCYMF